jgi:2-methylcitrate dehydratase
MLYIVATLLRKAYRLRQAGWRDLMLLPTDYEEASLHDPLTRRLMDRIEFRHGGPDYDARYPDGIPTTLEIEHDQLGRLSSGLVMYPEGHARNENAELAALLNYKFEALASTAVRDVEALRQRFTNMRDKTPEEIATLHDFQILGLTN